MTAAVTISAPSALTASERLDLAACEVEIEDAFDQMRQAWRRIGAALGRIHAGHLYRAWADTFEEYVESRWQLPRSTAYEWMEAAGVVLNIESHAAAYAVVIEPPSRINHARQLARLPADEQAPALMEARETAHTNGRTEPTHYEVQRVVTARLGEPEPRSPQETAHIREQRSLADAIRRFWLRLDDIHRAALLDEFSDMERTPTNDN